MENFFMALADKTRLRLLNLMRDGEICVCFFTEVLNESQPKISRHLAYLRNAGIVEARRDGKWMHYRIIEPESDRAAAVLQDTLDWLASEEEMRKDYEKLASACCAPLSQVTITRAPKPDVFADRVNNQEEKRELETFML
ncbi:MAG: metalloregulator ArsR/SmtB family transcription factor [Pyrinomonadaceae bacterium]|nr:metalloregulator ArsR/SmtB family transcription factor [Pyrinomonadaceae bacterium]